MENFTARVQEALVVIDKFERISTESIFKDYEFTDALSYFTDSDKHGELARLIMCNDPHIRGFGLFISSELEKRADGLLSNFKHLQSSTLTPPGDFILEQILEFNHVDDWACAFVDRTLHLFDERERVMAIRFLLRASEATMKKALSVSVSKNFKTARELLNFEEPKFERREVMYHRTEKRRNTAYRIALRLKIGESIDTVEAEVTGDGAHLFDWFRGGSLRTTKIFESFLDEQLENAET